MDRREALRRVGVLMGGALSASTIAGVLGGCQAGPAVEPFVPQTLDGEQDALVTTIAELIIPETDTPGARAARVNEFIDRMLTDWFKAEERDHFVAGLSTVDARAQEGYGKPFLDLTPEEQTELLTAMDGEALDATSNPPPFFRMMKELTLFGYYTSEVGATQELRDMPFGEYRGAVPYGELGRAWA